MNNACQNNADDSNNCSDGLFCTVNDRCSGGSCIADIKSVDDGINCTTDSCDEENDTIVHAADDSYCIDGLWCNGLEYCDASLDCQSGTAVICDDGIGCTINSCDEGIDTGDNLGTCEYDPGLCECLADEDCDDLNPCTDDLCNPQLICEHNPNSIACEDGLF